ncbi:MAG: hypothetical protein ACAH59_00110 [Pseudobdellovibrionaceae bacterium]
MKQKLAYLTFMMAALVSASSFAWDGTNAGKKISTVELTTSSYNFRIRLEGNPTLCGTTATWAYMNEADVNYKSVVAAALSAKALNQTINLYTTKDATTGYCKIGYFIVL